MTELYGYKLENIIHKSAKTTVYKGVREADGKPVAVKILNAEHPPARDIAELRQEQSITATLDTEGVLRCLSAEKYKNGLALITEDFGGVSLDRIIERPGKPNLRQALEISLKVSSALGEIHHHNIIHKDIKPPNIIVNPETGAVRITDFGIAAQLSREKTDTVSPGQLEGTLAYLSPEQTGRMNRAVDFRTDFYSLGVTMYEMLTGATPFVSQDPMEMVHFHIAVLPEPPCVADPDIPKPVSNIIMKLLEKDAGDRYQGAYGIAADLEECLNQLEISGRISDFPIAAKDVSVKFQIPQKLYGRENETEILMSSFESVCRGTGEIMMVAGFSGIGKTVLVNEIHRPVIGKKGFFISGKFDQFKKDVPYSAVARAFQELCRQLLSESSENLETWKIKLSEALGPNGRIITDLIPDMELIIGEQPPVQEFSPAESQNRFNIVFRDFVSLFADEGHPLVLFADDLQWADSSSLNLIQLLITDPDMKHLFIIGAYRVNEVDEGHPLLMTLDEIRKEGKEIRTVHLPPLDPTDLNRLVADTMHCDEKTALPLSELVGKKTGGNPFFAIEFLMTLYREDMLGFDSLRGRWKWNLEDIREAGITDNVVELMSGKIRKLAPATREVLKLASYVGSKFDLNILSVLCEKSYGKVAYDLEEALQEELIVPLDGEYKYLGEDAGELFKVRYRFLHDRVRQAAYDMTDSEERQQVHLSVGRLMLQNMKEEEQDENLIEIVRHLNEGRKRMEDESERENLARLNLRAGIKARNSAAYLSAFHYIGTGMEMLSENSWETQYELTLALNREYSQSAYLSGKHGEAENRIKIMLNRIKTESEKVGILHMQSVQYATMGRMREAIQAAIEALSLIGIRISEKPNGFSMIRELLLSRIKLRKLNIADIIEMPALADHEKQLAVKLLMEICAPAFTTGNRNLLGLAALKMTNLSLRYGNAPESAYAYVCFGIASVKFGDLKTGYEFGKLAVALNERFPNRKLQGRIMYLYASFIYHWNEHWSKVTPLHRKGMDASYQSGDLMFLAANCLSGIYGNPKSDLAALCHETKKSESVIRKTKYQNALDMIIMHRQQILNFRGMTEDHFSMTDGAFDELRCLEGMKERNFMTGIAMYYIIKSQLCYFYEDYSTALVHVGNGDKTSCDIAEMWFAVIHCFFAFLSHAGCYPEMSVKEKSRARRRMKKELKRMKKWADHCPVNFLHRRLIMEAEMARLFNKPQQAGELYDQAVRAAKENEWLSDEALANELAAKFYLERGQERIAGMYMKEAGYLYARWGAARKVGFLEETYPQLFAGTPDRNSAVTSATGSATGSAELDLNTVMKASRSISGEIRLERLLDQLMKNVIENAGAQRGLLILENKGEFFTEAEKDAGESEVKVLQSQPVSQSRNLSAGIVNLVARTKTDVVLNDAVNEGEFMNDPHIAENRPKSVICSPIIYHGKLMGMIYLENNLAKGAFTPERVEMIRLLSSQAAVSIENARLYENLELKVEERTLELNQALERITDSIRYAERIQRSLLPNPDDVKTYLPDSFFLWMPRDIVGGDIYFTEQFKDGIIIAVIDCTGHGVPGAFMSMIASSFIRRITTIANCHDPAEILKQLNSVVKTSLQQERKDAPSDDGLDAAVCFIEARGEEKDAGENDACPLSLAPRLIFAGAKLPLFYVHNREVTVIKGDKQSIGYKRSDPDFGFTNHTIRIEKGMSFYMSSDGFWDQLGGERRRSFGKKRFRNLLKEVAELPFEEQRKILVQRFEEYKGENDRQDDVTVVGFRF
ncbi:AAA family ATPase [Desulfobacterales bacterium HSG2]|nr:AAA family ATPase [Desulfobacterales bacterium HSG2]